MFYFKQIEAVFLLLLISPSAEEPGVQLKSNLNLNPNHSKFWFQFLQFILLEFILYLITSHSLYRDTSQRVERGFS